MNRKSLTIAATTVTAVSSAILVTKKVKNNKKDEKINTYRNTELGKYDKNAIYRRTDCKSKSDQSCVFSERTRGTVDEKWQRIPLEKA